MEKSLNDKKSGYIICIVTCSIISLISFIYTTYNCIKYSDVFEGSYPEVYFAIFICIVGVTGLTANILNISKINNETKPMNTKVDYNISELVKYKDLLDIGIINKEDFEKKKKQLLGL